MASDLFLAPVLYRCYYCQFESTDNTFKYFDNKKVDQPRHQCHNCHKLFTLGSHGRRQGRTYAKKRNEDPEELKNLSRECRHCGVADNALFKYYNNNNRLQPRFKCLSCGKQFQMRLMGTGDELRLVHTSCNQRQATGRCKKLGVPEAFTNASNFGVQENCQPSDNGSLMPLPFDPLMPLEPGMRLLPENCGEDEQYASFLETELTDDNEPPNVDPISWNANVDNVWLPENCAEDEQYALFLETELTHENEQAPNADPIIRTLNEDYGLPLDVCAAENAKFLAFLEAGSLTNGNEAANVDNVYSTGVRVDESNDAEMVSDNMTNYMDSYCTSNPEVVSGTRLVETLAPTQPDSWSNYSLFEDSPSLDYLDAALACCDFMDMAHSNPVAPVQLGESSSSSVGLTTSFCDSSCANSKPISFQQDLMMAEDQRSVNGWNEWQEEAGDMEIAPWF